MCFFNKNNVCRGIQVCTQNKVICCDELDEILYETVLEITTVMDDLLDKPLYLLTPETLFERGIRILSYASNICPIEIAEQKEVMNMITVFINEFRKSKLEHKEELIFNDFLLLLKYLKNWFRIFYMGYSYSESDLIDNIITLFFKISSILTEHMEEDYLF